MPTTIQLGKDTTITGLTGVQEVSMTIESEKVDATTRGSSGSLKRTMAGLQSRTLEATVLGDGSQTWGSTVAVTSSGFSITGVITSVKRSQPIGGAESCSITIKPGVGAGSTHSV